MGRSTSIYIDEALEVFLSTYEDIYGGISSSLRIASLRYASLIEPAQVRIMESFTAAEFAFMENQTAIVKKNVKQEQITLIDDIRRVKEPIFQEAAVVKTTLMKKLERLEPIQLFALSEQLFQSMHAKSPKPH